MAGELEAVRAEVERQTTVTAGVRVTLNRVVKILRDLAAAGPADPAALTALAASIKTNTDGLAEDIVTGTAAADENDGDPNTPAPA